MKTEWDMSDTAHILDDAEFADGDFVLVSADGVRFRTASYHLLWARWAGWGGAAD